MISSRQTKAQSVTSQVPFFLRFGGGVVLFYILLSCAQLAFCSETETIKIGVLAKQGSEQAHNVWSTTAEYLTATIPQYSFAIVPIGFDQVRQATAGKSIDFLLTNSGNYVELEFDYGISRIVTLKNSVNNTSATQYGGVIFTRANRKDINTLHDLIGKSFYAVAPESFGGWLTALREMQSLGINPKKDFKELHFGGTHDAVVIAVLDGATDAGTVRTDTLERMAAEGKVDLTALKVLNAQPPEGNFSYLHSTRLYPEWPLAKLQHTSESLAEKVAIALLNMPADSPAARDARIDGWTVPLDYQPVHQLYQELGFGPYARHLGQIRLTDLIHQHWKLLLFIASLFCLLFGITLFTILLNRRLVAAQDEISTQLKRTQKAQEAQNAADLSYQEIFNGTNDAIMVHDSESGAIVDVNQAMCNMYLYSREEAITLNMEGLSSEASPFTKNEATKWLVKARDAGPQKFEWQARRKNGELFWVEIHLKTAVIGHHERVLAVIHDISERKEQEKELTLYRQHLEQLVEDRTAEISSSEKKLARAQRIANLGSWEWDIRKNTLFWAKEMYPIFGLTRDDLPVSYDFFLDLVHPADRQRVDQTFNDAVSKRTRVNLDHRLLLTDGSEKMVNEQAEIFYGEDGIPLKMIGTIQDITERKLLEQEHSHLVKAVEQTGDSIIITDKAGDILYVNPAFERITGYSKDEVLGKNPRILKSGRQDPSFYQVLWDTLSSGRVWAGHLINKKKNGTLFEEAATIFPILDADGNISSYVSVKLDVTARVELEKQLRQAQKLEAIGTLAGGIAHDFNNILTAILGYGQIVLQALPEGSALRNNQQEVVRASTRAADLVKQILTFSRRSELQLQPLSMQLVVKEALKLLRASIPSTIVFRQDIDQDCGSVLADPTQIHQVVMNLCTNAYHAMRETGGVLSVTLKTVELGPHDPLQNIHLLPGPHVCLEVTDTGHGMEAMVADRIFEPYFTTKETGEGTGLGLSLVHGIIKDIGGTITVTSEVGVGSTFRVHLPRVETKAGTEESPAAGSIPVGTEHIMIVDDEQTILTLEKILLESLGYSVSSFSTSTEALQAFEAAPQHFDLVLSDVTMPLMNGTQLAKKMLVARPDMPILFCTGFSDLLNEQKAMALGAKGIIGKPILRENLARTIRKILDAG
ncbi:MAG: PAS domain S-box protein [Desulfoarculaceae bacterium]|nr:PAS domain S-box protein [Desulfoarculaceae bacterium]